MDAFFLFPTQLGDKSVGLGGLISSWTLAASPRLSFFDGENYSQMRGKKGKVRRWRDEDLRKEGIQEAD